MAVGTRHLVTALCLLNLRTACGATLCIRLNPLKWIILLEGLVQTLLAILLLQNLPVVKDQLFPRLAFLQIGWDQLAWWYPMPCMPAKHTEAEPVAWTLHQVESSFIVTHLSLRETTVTTATQWVRLHVHKAQSTDVYMYVCHATFSMWCHLGDSFCTSRKGGEPREVGRF